MMNALRMGNLPVITYATCVFGFRRKPPKFPDEAGYVGCAACVLTRGVSPIRVSSRRLAVPRLRHGFEARRVFFCPLGVACLGGRSGQKE